MSDWGDPMQAAPLTLDLFNRVADFLDRPIGVRDPVSADAVEWLMADDARVIGVLTMLRLICRRVGITGDQLRERAIEAMLDPPAGWPR